MLTESEYGLILAKLRYRKSVNALVPIENPHGGIATKVTARKCEFVKNDWLLLIKRIL